MEVFCSDRFQTALAASLFKVASGSFALPFASKRVVRKSKITENTQALRCLIAAREETSQLRIRPRAVSYCQDFCLSRGVRQLVHRSDKLRRPPDARSISDKSPLCCREVLPRRKWLFSHLLWP